MKIKYKRKVWFVNRVVVYVNAMTENAEMEAKISLTDMKSSKSKDTEMGQGSVKIKHSDTVTCLIKDQ